MVKLKVAPLRAINLMDFIYQRFAMQKILRRALDH